MSKNRSTKKTQNRAAKPKAAKKPTAAQFHEKARVARRRGASDEVVDALVERARELERNAEGRP